MTKRVVDLTAEELEHAASEAFGEAARQADHASRRESAARENLSMIRVAFDPTAERFARSVAQFLANVGRRLETFMDAPGDFRCANCNARFTTFRAYRMHVFTKHYPP